MTRTESDTDTALGLHAIDRGLESAEVPEIFQRNDIDRGLSIQAEIATSEGIPETTGEIQESIVDHLVPGSVEGLQKCAEIRWTTGGDNETIVPHDRRNQRL
jgi:exonuclease V gamma subunit